MWQQRRDSGREIDGEPSGSFALRDLANRVECGSLTGEKGYGRFQLRPHVGWGRNFGSIADNRQVGPPRIQRRRFANRKSRHDFRRHIRAVFGRLVEVVQFDRRQRLAARPDSGHLDGQLFIRFLSHVNPGATQSQNPNGQEPTQDDGESDNTILFRLRVLVF